MRKNFASVIACTLALVMVGSMSAYAGTIKRKTVEQKTTGHLETLIAKDQFNEIQELIQKKYGYTVTKTGTAKDGTPMLKLSCTPEEYNQYQDSFYDEINSRDDLLTPLLRKYKTDYIQNGWLNPIDDDFHTITVEVMKGSSLKDWDSYIAKEYKNKTCTNTNHKKNTYYYWAQKPDKSWVQYAECNDCKIVFKTGNTAGEIVYESDLK